MATAWPGVRIDLGGMDGGVHSQEIGSAGPRATTGRITDTNDESGDARSRLSAPTRSPAAAAAASFA